MKTQISEATAKAMIEHFENSIKTVNENGTTVIRISIQELAKSYSNDPAKQQLFTEEVRKEMKRRAALQKA